MTFAVLSWVMLSETTLRRILLDIVLGRKPKVSTSEEQRARDSMARDVERIRKKGGIVDVPSDIPGPD